LWGTGWVKRLPRLDHSVIPAEPFFSQAAVAIELPHRPSLYPLGAAARREHT
jgi:hypothetical protein